VDMVAVVSYIEGQRESDTYIRILVTFVHLGRECLAYQEDS